MKRTVIALLLLLLILTASSCGHIADTNGVHDISLADITEDEIVHGMSSVSSGRLQTSLNGRTSITIKKFSGVQTLETFDGKSGRTLRCDIELRSGNLRVVVVHDEDIVAEFAVGGGECGYVFPDNGTYRLKIAGETAEFDIKFSVQ